MFNKLKNKPIVMLIIALAVVGGAFFLFVELADDVWENESFQIDQMVSNFVSSIQSDTLDQVFGFITEIGAVWLITTLSIITGIFLLFYRNHRLWRFIYFAVIMIGISFLTSSLKSLFERERPNILEQYDGSGFSFPSGHSTGPMVFYGFIIYLAIRSRLQTPLKWVIGVALGLLILLIGFSRIYLGVHYATDVIGGFSLGLAWLLVGIMALEFTMWKRNNK